MTYADFITNLAYRYCAKLVIFGKTPQMNRRQLFEKIQQKQSFLCVGLDTDIRKIPKHLLKEKDPVFEFNKQIIDHTLDYAIAYKPNIAFYEAMGPSGWDSLQKTLEYIPSDLFTIADAKRGDIGNTSELYAQAFFEKMSFDSLTVAPYMGSDSVKPFFKYKDKWVILLALTSNIGSADFQNTEMANGKKLFEDVLEKSSTWGTPDSMMYVVGATQGEGIAAVRKLVPEHFFLVPGVGAQGGSLVDVAKYGMNDHCGLLVNSSRGIIYASDQSNFGYKAGEEAKNIQIQMAELLEQYL